MKIYTKNDEILRQPTEKVESFDEELQKLIDDMTETMRKENGIGLAAPQVGTSKKLLICEFKGDEDAKIEGFPLTVLCNPEIVHLSDDQINMVEGCLSFPGLELLVKRPKTVKIKGQDRYGKDIEIEADKLYARTLQHEIDHLNSILLIDHLQETKVVFIGTGDLGLPSLQLLSKDPQYKIVTVVTSKVEARTRDKNKVLNPIKALAEELHLPIIDSVDINSAEIIKKIADLKPEIGVLADFGQIINKELLDLPKYGTINIHPSLLPKYRGPAPVKQSILNGEKITGVTLIKVNEKMDAGGIISQVRVKLLGSETSTILKKYLAEIGASLLLNSLPYYVSGDLEPEEQNETEATYTHLFKKSDGLVDENAPEAIVERKVRAFDEWPKVTTTVNGKRIQILAVHFDQEKKLVIDRVKPEGKSEMNYDEYLRGYHHKLTFKQ